MKPIRTCIHLPNNMIKNWYKVNEIHTKCYVHHNAVKIRYFLLPRVYLEMEKRSHEFQEKLEMKTSLLLEVF